MNKQDEEILKPIPVVLTVFTAIFYMYKVNGKQCNLSYYRDTNTASQSLNCCTVARGVACKKLVHVHCS